MEEFREMEEFAASLRVKMAVAQVKWVNLIKRLRIDIKKKTQTMPRQWQKFSITLGHNGLQPFPLPKVNSPKNYIYFKFL